MRGVAHMYLHDTTQRMLVHCKFYSSVNVLEQTEKSSELFENIINVYMIM